jgi:hypothetical protein
MITFLKKSPLFYWCLLPLLLFSCTKEDIQLVKENQDTASYPAISACENPAVAELNPSGELLASLPTEAYQSLWEGVSEAFAPIDGGGGGGGVMHDITIWPTKALEDQGLGGQLGVSFVLDEAYFAASPESVVSLETTAALSFEAVEGGQWAPVLTTESGELVPISAEELGWSLKTIYATSDGDIGVIVSLEDVFAPVLYGGVVIIIDDDIGGGTTGETYGMADLYCCNGIIIAMDDIFFRPVQTDWNDLQDISASWNSNTPYGAFPQLNFEWFNEEGTAYNTAVVLAECADENLRYWPF